MPRYYPSPKKCLLESQELLDVPYLLGFNKYVSSRQNSQISTRDAAIERTYARLSDAQDAEREALLWCIAAEGALPEVKTAREAHLITVRVELAQARLEWDAVTA